MSRKKIVAFTLIVLTICLGIVGAQRVNNRLAKQKTFNDLFELPTVSQRKQAYAKLTPELKAEIWRNDLIVKMMVRKQYEGTEKEKILRELANSLFPALFDASKTQGNPQIGDFAETPEAQRFFAAMGRYTNAFSPEETKLFCGTLGEPTNPEAEKVIRDNALFGDGGDPSSLGLCNCSAESFCTSCNSACNRTPLCTKHTDCGCFWLSDRNGLCPESMI